jgi:hypothetical protein
MSIWKKFVDFFFVPMPTEVVPETNYVEQINKIIEEEKTQSTVTTDQITDSVTQAKPKRKPRAKKVKDENIT